MSRADLLIVGQGLAGTLLAWEFARAGFAFEIVDAGDGSAGSRVGAGMINPVSGRRFTKTWSVDAWLGPARAAYAHAEAALGLALWQARPLCINFSDTQDAARLRARAESGALAPYLGGVGPQGAWVEGAARVDLGKLLEASAAHWRAQGCWRRDRVDPRGAAGRYHCVIDCRGLAGARAPSRLPFVFSKGETLTVRTAGHWPEVIRHAPGRWFLPLDATTAVVGATHEPGRTDAEPSAAARAVLLAAAADFAGQPVEVVAHAAGVRVHLPDKHPVAGRDPEDRRLGLVNGLGGKGTLWAPALARQWVHHLAEGVAFTPEVDAARFAGAPV